MIETRPMDLMTCVCSKAGWYREIATMRSDDVLSMHVTQPDFLSHCRRRWSHNLGELYLTSTRMEGIQLRISRSR